MRIVILVGGGFLALIVFIVVLLSFVFGVTQPVVDAGNNYMQALKDGRTNDAYAMLAPEVQDAISQDNFFGAYLESWTISQRSIRNGVGKMAGSAIIDGENYSYELYFREIDGEWRITSYQF